MRATIAAGAATALLTGQASAYFILTGTTLAIDRQDAIVSPGPGVVAQHVHNLVGVSAASVMQSARAFPADSPLLQASSINSNSSFESLLDSNCTTLPVTVDKSAYWQPQRESRWGRHLHVIRT